MEILGITVHVIIVYRLIRLHSWMGTRLMVVRVVNQKICWIKSVIKWNRWCQSLASIYPTKAIYDLKSHIDTWKKQKTKLRIWTYEDSISLIFVFYKLNPHTFTSMFHQHVWRCQSIFYTENTFNPAHTYGNIRTFMI